MNIHIVSGNISRISEPKSFKNGTDYVTFTVASDDPQSTKDEADFLTFRVSGDKAVASFLKWAAVGRLIECQGRPIRRSFEAKDGTKRMTDYTRLESYKWLSAPKARPVDDEDEIEDEEEVEETPAPKKQAKPAPKAAVKPAAQKKRKSDDDDEEF